MNVVLIMKYPYTAKQDKRKPVCQCHIIFFKEQKQSWFSVSKRSFISGAGSKLAILKKNTKDILKRNVEYNLQSKAK